MNRDFCTGCVFLGEDSLSCEIDWYYSCQNENSKNYLVREDDLEAFTKDGEVCPDKKTEEDDDEKDNE